MFERIYLEEPMPTGLGYSGNVRVLANMTGAELTRWYGAHLGLPGCEACAAAEGGRCADCQAARAAFGQSITLIYGPTLLGRDVATPEAALAAFDDDNWLPAELVTWLIILPDSLRARRVELIRKNAVSSSESRGTS